MRHQRALLLAMHTLRTGKLRDPSAGDCWTRSVLILLVTLPDRSMDTAAGESNWCRRCMQNDRQHHHEAVMN